MPRNNRLNVQKKQKRHYSGKKKRHTQKAQLIVDGKSAQILATDFCHGSQHDFQLFKQNNYALPKLTCILADAGYQGLAKMHLNSQTPAKKSKLHPLNTEQKANNLTLSKKRILVENIFCKLKTFRILSERYRNPRTRFSLRFNLISALYNLNIQHNLNIQLLL